MSDEVKDIADRLVRALKAKGISARSASMAAGLNPSYIADMKRGVGGRLEKLEEIAAANGIDLHWLRTGEGEIAPSQVIAPPLNREEALLALAEVLGHFLPRSTHGRQRFYAQSILGIVEQPLAGMSETDKLNRIRNEIQLILRLFDRQLAAEQNQEDR